jgi:hypothetical protein
VASDEAVLNNVQKKSPFLLIVLFAGVRASRAREFSDVQFSGEKLDHAAWIRGPAGGGTSEAC